MILSLAFDEKQLDHINKALEVSETKTKFYKEPHCFVLLLFKDHYKTLNPDGIVSKKVRNP